MSHCAYRLHQVQPFTGNCTTGICHGLVNLDSATEANKASTFTIIMHWKGARVRGEPVSQHKLMSPSPALVRIHRVTITVHLHCSHHHHPEANRQFSEAAYPDQHGPTPSSPLNTSTHRFIFSVHVTAPNPRSRTTPRVRCARLNDRANSSPKLLANHL